MAVANPERLYRNYTNVRMSNERFLYKAHLVRIKGTIIDEEDLPLREDNVTLPTAPKKNRERGHNTNMPGSRHNERVYHFLPGIDTRYNNDRLLLQEQQEAKKLRKKNRGVKRLQPASRRRLFASYEETGEPSTSNVNNPDHMGVHVLGDPVICDTCDSHRSAAIATNGVCDDIDGDEEVEGDERPALLNLDDHKAGDIRWEVKSMWEW